MIRIIYKVLMILIIAILFLNMSANAIYGVAEIKPRKIYLQKAEKIKTRLRYYNEDKKTDEEEYEYMDFKPAGYFTKNGFTPTYCINKNLPGVEKGAYYISVESVLDNDKIWRIVKNGYPGKTAEQMGFEFDTDAYAVTQFAIYCVLGQAKLEYFKAEEGDEVGQLMLKKLKELVNIGENGTDRQIQDPISFEKVSTLKKEGDYYVQECKLNTKTKVYTYEIQSESEIPEGCYIGDKDGNQKRFFNNPEEHFKVFIPKEKIVEDLNFNIIIATDCESEMILEGISTEKGRQNYAVVSLERKYLYTNNELKLKANKSSITINKIDEDTKKPIQGVKFGLYDSNNNLIETKKTDKKGIARFYDLYAGNYTVTEIETNQKYIINDEQIEVLLKYEENAELTISNKLKKGNIKIIKTDRNNENIKLEGVKFEITNEDNKKIGTYTTDKNGEIYIENLPIGIYIIKEKETLKEYELEDIEIQAEVKQDETTQIPITNKEKEIVPNDEIIKGKIQIIKTSKDYNKMNETKAGTPLEGVKFEIYDSNGNIIESVITNKNGIAITSDLDKGEYIIKEVETNRNYYLNQEPITVKIDKEDTISVNITNESKNPDVDIEKDGPVKANVGEKIEYDISFRNTGNTPLDNLTVIENIPSKFINVKKIKTGTYNQDLSYNLYYKTNKSKDYVLLMEDLKSKENYEINFEDEISQDEYITNIKIEFNTVDIGFSSNENLHITGIVKETVKSEESFTNVVDISGSYQGYKVYDKEKCKTTAYKFLPRTGF